MLFRAGLKPIEPIAYNWAPCRSYLLHAVQVHTTTRCRFYREQLGPTPPIPGPGAIDITRYLYYMQTNRIINFTLSL
jgi:hypothetical protein